MNDRVEEKQLAKIKRVRE